MERLNARKLIDVLAAAPIGEAAGRVHIGPPCMVVIDLSGEEFQDAPRRFRRWRKKRRLLDIRRRRNGDFVGHTAGLRVAFSGPLPVHTACDKGGYHTRNGTGRGFFPVTLAIANSCEILRRHLAFP
jgi:hypothetical protein